VDERWRASKRSDDGGTRIEVRRVGSTVELRDGHDRSGPVLRFGVAEWSAFVEAVKDDRLR
jgi:hypothetical protein